MRHLARLALAGAIAATFAAPAPPAAAHTCATAAEIPVGEPVNVTVGVTVESTPVPEVEITVPPGLELDAAEPSADWALAVDEQRVVATGPEIAPNSCKFFTLRLTATDKGVYGITVVQRDASGAVVAESAPIAGQPIDRFLVQAVYAGVRIPTGAGGGFPVALAGGVGLIAVAAVVLVVMFVRNRRADDDTARTDEHDDDRDRAPDATRADELQARVDEFRKQARARGG